MPTAIEIKNIEPPESYRYAKVQFQHGTGDTPQLPVILAPGQTTTATVHDNMDVLVSEATEHDSNEVAERMAKARQDAEDKLAASNVPAPVVDGVMAEASPASLPAPEAPAAGGFTAPAAPAEPAPATFTAPEPAAEPTPAEVTAQ